MTAEKSARRYEGLVRTAQKLFDANESSSWRLANVIYDALTELHSQGLALRVRGTDKAMGPVKLSADLDRHRMGPSTVYRYYLVWKRYGPSDQRIESLSFYDHLVLSRESSEKNPDYPAYVTALQDRRKAMVEGRKPAYSDAASTLTALKRGNTYADSKRAWHELTQVKRHLRRVAASNVWDCEDPQKLIEHLDDIQGLLNEVRSKPWTRERGAA